MTLGRYPIGEALRSRSPGTLGSSVARANVRKRSMVKARTYMPGLYEYPDRRARLQSVVNGLGMWSSPLSTMFF